MANLRWRRGVMIMKSYKHLWERLYSYDNLQEAYELAALNKTANPKVQEFADNARVNLLLLMHELFTKTYRPKPLRKFILRDPKTRLICVSEFRDRVIHHALVNVLRPIFEPRFIYDSFASQKGKGTLAAIKRFELFMRKVSENGRQLPGRKNANSIQGYVLKADIRRYFETVDHDILLTLLRKRIKDEHIQWLVKVILDNYDSGVPDKGIPLGNWTSQFFANVYLHELDLFVKHNHRAKYYIRYVDDFVILHHSKAVLMGYEQQIKEFVKLLKLELHPTKCKIMPLRRGISFLGFHIFYKHKLVRQRNYRKIKAKIAELLSAYEHNGVNYWTILEVLYGWNAYALHGNTYNLRQNLEEWVKEELETKSRMRKASETGFGQKSLLPSLVP